MKKLLYILTVILLATTARAADVGYTTIPAFPWSNYNYSSMANHTIDATNDSVEYLFQCQAACTITDLGYLGGSRTGTPCATQISLQGVNSSGRADGTIKSSSNAKASFTPPASTADDDIWKWRTLTSSYACTGGEFLAAVISDVSDGCTPDGSNSFSYAYRNNNFPGAGFPHAWSVAAGSGTAEAGPSIYGYKCGSAVYGNVVQSVGSYDFGSDSTPDERGNYFKFPASSCSTVTLAGVRLQSHAGSAGSTWDIVTYAGLTGTSAMSGGTVTLDTDYWRGISSTNGLTVFFPTPLVLTCGSDYVVASKPAATGGTASALGRSIFSANGDMSSLPLGVEMYYANRTDAAANWTTDSTTRAYIDLIITDITEPSAGGGGVRNQNQTSGGAQ